MNRASFFCFGVICSMAGSISLPARAEPRRAEHAPRVESPSEWYGAPILAIDAGALALGGVGLVARPVLALAGAAYLFGGPIVHFTRGHASRGGISLALRAGLPLLGAFLGFGTTANYGAGSRRDSSNDDTLTATIVGASIGGALAITFDSLFLAHEAVSPERPHGVRWMPTVSVGRETSAGIAGSF